MPAARGVKRSASKSTASSASTAPKNKKKRNGKFGERRIYALLVFFTFSFEANDLSKCDGGKACSFIFPLISQLFTLLDAKIIFYRHLGVVSDVSNIIYCVFMLIWWCRMAFFEVIPLTYQFATDDLIMILAAQACTMLLLHNFYYISMLIMYITITNICLVCLLSKLEDKIDFSYACRLSNR